MSLSSLQKSYCYVDVMLSSLQFPPDALYLIGISALILAAKVYIIFGLKLPIVRRELRALLLRPLVPAIIHRAIPKLH